MPKATPDRPPLDNLKKWGNDDCYVKILGKTIWLDNLPDISDTKSATYNDETIIGRSTPLKTYSHSDNRTISMQIHFIVSEPNDVYDHLDYLRLIESAVYPRAGRAGAPYTPPPVCQIKCGDLLALEELCVILTSYSVKFPTDIVWSQETFCPYKFDVDTTWSVVYTTSKLPGQIRIEYLGK